VLKAAENVTVTDFLLHNVMGEASKDSFLPSFYGDRAWGRLAEELRGHNPLDKDGVYRIMQDHGFVSMLANEDCGNDITAYLGSKPSFDHVMASFW
jgi:hypothetical protein